MVVDARTAVEPRRSLDQSTDGVGGVGRDGKPRGKSWQARGEPGLVWRGQTAEICMTTAALGDLDKLPVLA